MKLVHPGSVPAFEKLFCLYYLFQVAQAARNSSEGTEKNGSVFFLLGVTFVCLAVGFTSMLYRSEAKQLFEFFLHCHLSVTQKFTFIH